MPDSRGDLVPDRRIMDAFDSIKRQTRGAVDYWLARDLQEPLGYTTWRNFSEAIDRARQACESVGGDPSQHFADVSKMVSLGSGSQRAVPDVALTRYAAYLTAMNGDPAKPEIAAAQAYFAVQTRRQEQADALSQADARIELRDRLKENVKALGHAASESGVERFGLFHDAGYRGLYGMGLSRIKVKKGIAQKEHLFDRAGRAELAANDFRITQTEDKLRREGIMGELNAMKTHQEVGREVRHTIDTLGGVMPEELPAEPSIKKLISAKRKQAKELPPPPKP